VYHNAHLKIGQYVEYDIIVTQEFDDWLESESIITRRRVKARIDNVAIGHFGLHKRFDGLIELKWLNGLRVYMFIWESTVIVALNGGNKNGQSYDIQKTKKIQSEILTGVRTLLKPRT